ncbi:MAG: ABC transporter ATP-binding protein [Solirubrobacteraceae bacterium]
MSDAPPTGSPLRFVATLLARQRRAVVLLILLTVGIIAMTLVTPLLTGWAVDRIENGDLTGSDGAFVAAGAIALAGLLTATLSAAAGVVNSRISTVIESDLRSQLYHHFQVVDPQVLDARATGDLVSLASSDLIPIAVFFGNRLSRGLRGLVTMVLAGVIMFWLEPLLALVALAPLPVGVVILAGYTHRARPKLFEARRAMGALTTSLQETLAGVATVRAYARESEQREHFARAAKRVLDSSLAVNRMGARSLTAVDTLPLVGSALVVIVGGRLAISGDLSVVAFSVFYTYVVMLVPSVQAVGLTLGQAQPAFAGLRRVLEVLRAPVQGSPTEPPLPVGPAGVRMRGVRADSPGGDPILQGVDLDAPAGGTIAVLGMTGSGKSTLLALVNRLRDAGGGTVEVAGARVGEVEIGSLRRAIGTATDDNFLFSGTVRENIAFARPDASLEDVEAAARAAQAHDFITALPDGYDTILGDRGVGLSGGQRQRVALARALLAGAVVLLLDNATGNLDALTEAAVLDELDAFHTATPPTRIVVAYRPAVLRRADEVLLLEDGRIVERGTHDALLRSSARYRALVGVDAAGDPGRTERSAL